MKPETKLARVFATVADQGTKTDSIAAGILAIVVEARVHDVEQFNPLVTAAYAANGWNARPGRPDSGESDKGEVPATVRTYVTIVRRAFRAGIRVAAAKSFTALRKMLAKASGKHRKKPKRLPAEVRESFVGVDIAAANDVNGALFHDLGAVYMHLPSEHRDMMGRQLSRLLGRYLPLAKGVHTPPPALPLREAA